MKKTECLCKKCHKVPSKVHTVAKIIAKPDNKLAHTEYVASENIVNKIMRR